MKELFSGELKLFLLPAQHNFVSRQSHQFQVSAAAAMAIKLSVFSGLSSEVRETIKSLFSAAAAAAAVDQAAVDQVPTNSSKAEGADAPQTFPSMNHQNADSPISGAAAETISQQDTGEGWKNGATAVASHAMCTG
jgi:hypothetical protein